MLNHNEQGVIEWSHSMVDPFSGGKRMPSPVPVESCLYSDKGMYNITIGSGQDFVLLFNPQAISGGGNASLNSLLILARNTSLASYSSTTWYGHAVSSTPANYATNFAYPGANRVPVKDYSDQIRVSSAGFKIRYIGSELNKAGMFVWGKTKEKDVVQKSVPMVSDVLELMNSGTATADEGVYEFWLPIDIEAFQFKYSSDIETSVTILHGFGFPTGMVLNIQYVINYEYIPTIQYHELLASNAQLSPSSSEQQTASLVEKVKEKTKGFIPLKRAEGGFLDVLKKFINTAAGVAGNVLGVPGLGMVANLATSMIGGDRTRLGAAPLKYPNRPLMLM